MKLSQFKFRLPEEQIAQFPSSYPEDARMLVLHRKNGKIEHKNVRDIVEYFGENDLFVFNDTQVFPARLFAKKEKTLANIEVFLLRELNHATRYWDVVVDPARKIRVGNKLFFDEDPTIVAEVVDNTTARGRTFRFLSDYAEYEYIDRLYALGVTPLPKYIIRPMEEETLEEYQKVFHEQSVADMDRERYQSIFAKHIGAVAAPAASLHFSKQLLKRMEIHGIEYTTLTDHLGLGEMKTIDVDDLTKFKSDSEQIIVTKDVVDHMNKARSLGAHICAVGTEVMRAIEHVVGASGQMKEFSGWTNRFIYPPYQFTAANTFFANLYLPQSIPLLMVAAFGGYEHVMNAYEVAVNEGYLFGDYGDAMLIVD